MDTKTTIASGAGAAALIVAAAVHFASPGSASGSGAVIEVDESARPPAIVHSGVGAMNEPQESARPPRR